MPASEASAKEPNLRLMEARRRLPSPRWPNLRMSRSDVADGVNAKLHELYPNRKDLKYHTVDFRWVGKLERGDTHWTSCERRAALRAFFGVTTDAELGLYPNRRTESRTKTTTNLDQPRTYEPSPLRPPASVDLAVIRASLDTFDLPPDGVIRSPAELNEAVAGLIRLRLRSNYQRLAIVLPSLLDELHRAQIAWTGQRGSIATLLLTQAYRAADALADKFGHHDLSARIIAMMTDAARRTGDATVLATAHYVRGELFFENGRPDLGRAVLEKAADEVSTCTGTFAWAAYGALHMRAAVLAGIAQQSEQAKDHLREAGEYAQLVSDGEYHGTAFGPSSVRIHEVTLAVDSDDPDAALRAARGWIPPNDLPGERRSHFYIDLARAHSQTRSTEPACDALFQAKLAAPEHARIHPQVRQVVSDLLPRVTAAHPLHDYVRWMTSTAATG